MRLSLRSIGATALLGLAACGDPLSIPNYNSPDVSRVLFNAASVEAAIGGLGPQLLNPQRACNLNVQSKIMSEESFATVANFGMAARAANKTFISNELGNDLASSNAADYQAFQRVQRLSFNPLVAFASIKAANKNTLTATRENRMRAFAYFVAGQALGYVAFVYDSGAVASEALTTSDIPKLSSAADMGAKAVEYLDSAVTIAGRGTETFGTTYISGLTLTGPQFIALAKGYRARIRAGVARNPTERANVNWAAVVQDAADFSAVWTGDVVIKINGTTGVSAGCDAGQLYVAGWHQLPMKFIGVADTSGGYQAWSATANATRRAFLVLTPDKRWPSGSIRGDDCTAAAAVCTGQQTKTNVLPTGVYIRNRPPGNDLGVLGEGDTFYDHRRYGLTQSNGSVPGDFTEMSKTEVDMLRAEGLIRIGGAANITLAETLINLTRTKNGLPSVTGVGTAGRVPGGAGCVPKMADGTCGSLLEAMKYEKRMETYYTGYFLSFADSRGWGDLPVGTAYEWPVPYQEMQSRLQPYYNGTKQVTAADAAAATRGKYGY